MKVRSSKEIEKALLKKGFAQAKGKDHHAFYYFMHNGQKTHIYTYLSHGSKDYNKNLMGQIKKQLKFSNSNDADSFLDCPFKQSDYVSMLQKAGEI